MAPDKVFGFYKQGNDWLCKARLPSDITIIVDGVNFHLHKFPLVSKCGKIACIFKELKSAQGRTFTTKLDEFPGGSNTFLFASKFCYGIRVEFTARNIITMYCAADYLGMTDEYGEDNLLSKAKSFFHKNVLCNWKDCVLALRSCELCMLRAEKLNIFQKCLNALSTMVCTDPSLFGWSMMMYGSLQSPGGSIIWNGINTGARIRSAESDWWFEDISYFSVDLFERLIKTMEEKGIRSEHLAGAIMYYARKYLPGLGRWQNTQSGKARTVECFNLIPATVDQRILVESVEKLLPKKKGKSFCRFLLGLLRVALILDANQTCLNSLERRIGKQLELASLDGLLIPSFSDSDTLYNTDCVERIVHHSVSSESGLTLFSPPTLNHISSPSCEPLRKVARLMDNYLAEVASDVNLKPGKISSLAEVLPNSSRTLHDGLYRALDIYFKAHPWLSDREKEGLFNNIDYRKLSIEACAHASQNERLPLRIVLQVLFFEQMHLRTALASCLNVLEAENAPTGQGIATSETAGQIVQRDGWMTIVRENHVLKVDMDKMRSRVGELEEEICKIKQEIKKVTKSNSSLTSPSIISRKIGCKLVSKFADTQTDVGSTAPTPRPSLEQPFFSRHPKSFSLFQS